MSRALCSLFLEFPDFLPDNTALVKKIALMNWHFQTTLAQVINSMRSPLRQKLKSQVTIAINSTQGGLNLLAEGLTPGEPLKLLPDWEKTLHCSYWSATSNLKQELTMNLCLLCLVTPKPPSKQVTHIFCECLSLGYLSKHRGYRVQIPVPPWACVVWKFWLCIRHANVKTKTFMEF